MHSKKRILIAALSLLGATSSVRAQKAIIAGAGIGTGVGSRESASGTAGSFHGLAFAEAHLPIVPVGVRLDAMLLDAGKGGGPLVVTASAVFVAPIPIVQPYVMAGWGKYGVGRDLSRTGWNAGIGARITKGPIHLFGEARRHERLRRDLFTIGLTL